MQVNKTFWFMAFLVIVLWVTTFSKHYVDEKYAIKDNGETYYQLDCVVNELGHDIDINGDDVVLTVRNVAIELEPYSKEIVIKTPPYGTYLEDSGELGVLGCV